jgi:hypothetical protein
MGDLIEHSPSLSTAGHSKAHQKWLFALLGSPQTGSSKARVGSLPRTFIKVGQGWRPALLKAQARSD